MKKETETVQKIESYYVGEDCIQVMFPYHNTLTIINHDGILFHHKPESKLYINKYLEDDRRRQFPYSNIPTHFSKDGFFNKIVYTNQLMDFEKPYISISDGLLLESFAIKNESGALLISKIMQSEHHIERMTYEQLRKFVGQQNSDEQVYYVYLNGSLPSNNKTLYPTEEEIYNYIRTHLIDSLKEFKCASEACSTSVGRYLAENPWILDYLYKNILKVDFSSTDFNIGVSKSMLVIRINNGIITIQAVDVVFVKENDYKVDIYDIPVTKYSLEQLKYIPKYNISKEPKIPLRLNPGVTQQDIANAKKMIMSLKNSRNNNS